MKILYLFVLNFFSFYLFLYFYNFYSSVKELFVTTDLYSNVIIFMVGVAISVISYMVFTISLKFVRVNDHGPIPVEKIVTVLIVAINIILIWQIVRILSNILTTT